MVDTEGLRAGEPDEVVELIGSRSWKEYYGHLGEVLPPCVVHGQPRPEKMNQFQRVLFSLVSEEIERVLARRERARVWSAGSGIDVVSLMLKLVFADRVEITVFDISEKCIAMNRAMFAKFGMRAEFQAGDLFQSKYSNRFDIVMNTGLLEHFHARDQERLLGIISTSLVVGGSYITLTPYSGGRLYARFLRRAASRGTLMWPEMPVATLRGLQVEGMALEEERQACPSAQLAMIGLPYPSLASLADRLLIAARPVVPAMDRVLMKLIGGYCLVDRFVKAS